MKADVGAVFYALGAGLLVYGVVVMCGRTPGRIPLVPWRGRRNPAAPGFWYLMGAMFPLSMGIDLLSHHHAYWLSFLILMPPVMIAEQLVIVRHNRAIARAEPQAADFAVHQ